MKCTKISNCGYNTTNSDLVTSIAFLSEFGMTMNTRTKAFLAYIIYGLHFAAVLYFGIQDSDELFRWPYQKESSVLLILTGVFFYALAYFKLGIRQSSGLTFEGLITGGIYGVVRNPQLLGWMLVLVGISLYLDSCTAFLLTVALWLLFKLLLQPVEERDLERTYGADYLAYKRDTVSGI